MIQWEYKEESARASNVERQINELGSKGWEAYSVTPDDFTGDGEACFIVHMKRQKS